MHRDWLRVAIKICRSRADLARLIGVREEVITYWLNHGKQITLDYAIKIENATNGAVNRLQLVPYLDKKLKIQIKAEYEAAKNARAPLKFKEKVTMGLVIEEVLGCRQGTRTDRLLGEKILEVAINSPDFYSSQGLFSGRTEEIAAKHAGFGNYKTYQQAKQILKKGVPELIGLIDKDLPISRAAKIVRYPAEKQRYFLSFNRRDMLDELNKAIENESESCQPIKNNSNNNKEKSLNAPANESTAAWAMLSFVGLFKTKKIRSQCDEQDTNGETRAVTPRTVV